MSADGGDITLGEIARSLTDLKQQLADLRTDVSRLAFVRQDVWAVEREAIHERIEQVRAVAEASVNEVADDLQATKENLRWVVRTIAAIVLTVIIGAVLAANGFGG